MKYVTSTPFVQPIQKNFQVTNREHKTNIGLVKGRKEVKKKMLLKFIYKEQ